MSQACLKRLHIRVVNSMMSTKLGRDHFVHPVGPTRCTAITGSTRGHCQQVIKQAVHRMAGLILATKC